MQFSIKLSYTLDFKSKCFNNKTWTIIFNTNEHGLNTDIK